MYGSQKLMSFPAVYLQPRNSERYFVLRELLDEYYYVVELVEFKYDELMTNGSVTMKTESRKTVRQHCLV